MREKKAMTFGELKVELSKLTPEQLAAEVLWCGDERGGKVARLLVLEEEHISVGEGMEPRSAYKDDPPDETDVIATWPKGTPMLMVDDG